MLGQQHPLAERLDAASSYQNSEARRPSLLGRPSKLSATLENEADPTLENEATGSWFLVCRVLGSDAGKGVDAAVA